MQLTLIKTAISHKLLVFKFFFCSVKLLLDNRNNAQLSELDAVRKATG